MHKGTRGRGGGILECSQAMQSFESKPLSVRTLEGNRLYSHWQYKRYHCNTIYKKHSHWDTLKLAAVGTASCSVLRSECYGHHCAVANTRNLPFFLPSGLCLHDCFPQVEGIPESVVHRDHRQHSCSNCVGMRKGRVDQDSQMRNMSPKIYFSYVP